MALGIIVRSFILAFFISSSMTAFGDVPPLSSSESSERPSNEGQSAVKEESDSKETAVSRTCFVRLGENFYPPRLEVILPRRICYSNVTIDFRTGVPGDLIVIGEPFSDRVPFELVLVNNAVEVRASLRSGKIKYQDEIWSYHVQLRARLHSGGKIGSVSFWALGDIESPRGPEKFDQDYSPE